MKIKVHLAAAILLAVPALALAPALVLAQDASSPKAPFSDTEARAIEEIVRDYLIANPEVLVEALQGLEEKERLAKAENQRLAVKANLEGLMRDPASPVAGNPEGDITIVEFFDYRCPYCRRMTADLLDAVEQDGNIRLVFKEFPILGSDSVVAARAALAAAAQNRYHDFHVALMAKPGELNEPAILALAGDLGLDVERLRQDMDSEAVEQQLRDNHGLARNLQINGTPAFVIGEEVVPGAVPMQQLLEMVSQERAKTG